MFGLASASVRHTLKLAALLVLVAVFQTGCGESDEGALHKVFDGTGLATTEVKLARIASETDFDGVIEAVNQAVVSAQTSGRIVEMPFDVGDFVAQGAVVARFTDTEQQAGLAAAKAQLEEAKARFAEADQQLIRVADVHKRGMVAQAVFDQAKAAQKAAAARVESAKAATKDASERLSHTVVVAPYSGIVVKSLADVGATVAPGSPLLEGLSLDHLRVLVDIPQQHIGPLRKHKKARVILADGASISVTEMRIPPSADPSTHSFRVLLQLPEGGSAEPIFPGTLVKVAFVNGEREQLLVPSRAIARRGEVAGAYVISTSQSAIEFRYLRLGRALTTGKTTILAGLEQGETIVLDPVAAATAYKTQRFSGEK